MEWQWLDNIISQDSEVKVSGYIGQRGAPAQPNQDYLTIDVASLWITHVRRVFTKFYGALYGNVQVRHESGQTHSFQAFNALADAKELDANNLDRIIQGPYRLLESVPYRGAGINVRIALLAVASGNLAAPYMQLLKSISDVAGVSFITQALPLVEVIQKGVSAITNGDTLQTGRYGLIDQIYEGYYVVVNADPRRVPLADLGFDDNLRVLTLQGREVRDFPYFVLQFQKSGKRDFWQNIPDLQAAFAQMKKQFRETPYDYEANLRAFDHFRVTAELSPDLLSQHAKTLHESIRAEFANYLTEGHLGGQESFASLDSVEMGDFDPFAGQ